ncbi:MAG TPA: hypothetical protein VF741_07480 [Candidatus Aquilonibacter sp.]
MNRTSIGVLAAGAMILALSGCGGSSMGSAPMRTEEPLASSGSSTVSTVDTDSLVTDVDPPDGPSILATLNTETTIGSTVDPVTGDQNPYGLDIAPIDSGLIHRGDLIVCDFNDSANVQGTGNAIIALAPQPGSSPRPVITNAALLGCTENVQTRNGTIWETAFVAPDVAIVSPAGKVLNTLTGTPFTAPFGITLARDDDGMGNDPVFYESDATTGAIVRISAGRSGVHNEVIATGFAVNNGVPGTELGPSGLQYDPSHDRLYVVDGTNNTLVELRHVSTIPAGGITVGANGTSFSGPFAHRARLVFSGSPLNSPISSALLPNGNIAIGNTGNPNGENLMVEITPHGKVADVKNVDTGAAGALFGMTATTGKKGVFTLYFNDDNTNTVVALTR